MTHLRREFLDFWASTKSEIAREALGRIGKLFDTGHDINGQPADAHHAARQKLSQPTVSTFFASSAQQLLRISRKGDLANAFRYGLSRQDAFWLFPTDGRVAIDYKLAERPASDWNWTEKLGLRGAETLAYAMTVVETAKVNRLDPQA